MVNLYFIWKKPNIYLIKRTKNYFHITSTIASNFNQSKISWFFHDFSHFKLQSAPTQDKFLDFLQNEFSHSKCFQKAFFSLEWGASALRLRVPGWARTPIQWKKAFWKHFECENSFCKKVKEFILSRCLFQLKMAELPKKCMKFCFGWNLKRL